MKKTILALVAWMLATMATSAQVAFTGITDHAVIEVTPDKSTGLDKIYVVYDTDGVGMTYTASSDETVTWYSYGSQGGGYAEQISNITSSGRTTTLAQVMPNTGYIIEEGTDRTYCWVTNYADYYLVLDDLSITESKCSTVSLRLDGNASPIIYYSITGSQKTLSRELTLTYNTLEWDDTTHWQEAQVVEIIDYLDDEYSVTAPLCNTYYLLAGDTFLKQWGEGLEVETPVLTATSVGCGSTAVQDKRENDNEKGNDDSGLGGSAPCRIVFTGYPTDAVVYREWEMATDEEFENLVLQFNQDEVDYTFNEAGTWYMRYNVANADGSCEAYGETYTITIGESELVCPNVFSPGTTEGVNDVWKVSYKSLVEFHCWIFNRWGNLIKEFTDPGDGWDGTYHGKLVETGTYYYVVTAVGSDGVKYKKRGDINIIRWKQGGTSTTTPTE